MGIFRREIEVMLKAIGVAILVLLIILPVAWGYEQTQQVRRWQSVVCVYRINELTRGGALTVEPGSAPDACAVLARLGFSLEPEAIAPPSPFVIRRVTSRQGAADPRLAVGAAKGG